MLGFSPILNSYFSSDFFGKLIYLALFTLSIVSWVILLHKIYLVRKIKLLNLNLEKKIKSNEKELLKISLHSNFSYPYFDIFKKLKEKTLEILNKNRFYIDKKKDVYMSQGDIELIDSHLDKEISKQIKKIEKNIFLLPTIVTLAPFLGLLGTVWGILITFSSLQKSSLLSSNSSILSGLSMALATTVIGLVVAIPALVAYNYLKNSINNFKNEMENFSHELLSTLEIQYRNVDLK